VRPAVTSETLDDLCARALEHVSAGRVEEACQAFTSVVERDPSSPEGWINLATAERALGRLHLAVEHYLRGIGLLEDAKEDKAFLASALHALAMTYEALDLTEQAVAAYRQSAKNDPRAPTPLAALSTLLARAGHLEEADRVATEYCMAAVSVLAEKGNIGPVRRFQKAMKEATCVDGGLLLVATREAYVRGFHQTASQLPKTVELEAEPHRPGPTGQLEPVLVRPDRPFGRVRFDAVDPTNGQRWMIQEGPTYGFPGGCTAAAEGAFTVPMKAKTPFPTLINTRTAWDYFFVRLRFTSGLRPSTIERAESLLGDWYLRGFEGEFGEKTRGFFHFLSEPFAIGDYGLRYEVDLGLSGMDAIHALFETLTRLHQEEPIQVAVFGDGALPLAP